MGNICRRHCRLEDFKLEHDRPEDFVHSVLFISAMPYAAYVSCMCLYVVTMVMYSALNSVYGEKILIWLTYWSFYILTAKVSVTSVNAWIYVFRTVRYQRRNQKSLQHQVGEAGSALPVRYKFQWLLQNLSSCSALIVTLLFWTIQYSGINAPTMISVNSHAINSVLVLVDLLLSRAPVRVHHFIYTVVFFVIYILFSIIYWASGGENHKGEPYIYSMLDYNRPGRAVGVVIGVVLGVVPLIQTVLYALFRLRQWLWLKYGRGRTVQSQDSAEGEKSGRGRGDRKSGIGSGCEVSGLSVRDTKSGFPKVSYVTANDDPDGLIDVDLDFEIDEVVHHRPPLQTETSTTESTKALLA